MNHAGISLGLAALLGLAAAPAGADDTGWRVRGFGAFLNPDTSEMTVNGDGDEILVEAGGGFGGGGGVEYQFHRLVGVEAGITAASPEITLGATLPGLGALSLSENLSTTVLTGEVLVHLIPGSRVFDLYAGGGFAGVLPGGMSFDVLGLERLNVDAESYLTWSLRAGLDLGLGEESGWAASLGVRYVPGDVELRQLGVPADEGTAEFGFNILTLTAGVAYRF